MEPSRGQEQTTQPHRRVCVACPRCGKGYRIPARLIGRRLVCRHCREEWRAREIPAKEFRSGLLIGAGASSGSGTTVFSGDPIAGGSSGSIAIDTRWAGRMLGRYRVLSVLGHGGMGVVWRAHDADLRRDVALKILSQRGGKEGNGGSLNVELFKQEARAIATLEHPAVVPIFEVGADHGQVFLALQLMEGGTLKDYVERFGRIPPRELCAMMISPARALALAHRRGIVHRDIKPTNLMFDEHGHLKLMDFGLADVAQEAASEQMRGKTVGSLGWIAPETARGQATTATSDIYSMGLVMLYALTGRPWLRALSRGELMALHQCPPELDLSGIRGLTPSGAAVLETCLKVEPAERYLTADLLADAFQACADEDPSEISRKRKSHASVAVVAAVFGGLLGGAAVLQYFLHAADLESQLGQSVIRAGSPAVPDRKPAAPQEAAPEGDPTAPLVAERAPDPASDAAEAVTDSVAAVDLGRPWPEVIDGSTLKYVATQRGRVFHLATSTCGRSIYASNLLQYETTAEALDAGRKPCSRCRPLEPALDVAVAPETDP